MLKKKVNTYLINFLLLNQIHIGKKKKKWNKSLNIYLFGIREGIFFFNLRKTHYFLKRISYFLKKSIIKHHSFIFIGVNTIIHPLIIYLSNSINQPNISISWVGGSLTNWFVIKNYAKFLYSKNLKLKLHLKFKLKSEDKLNQKVHKYLKMKKKLKGLEKASKLPNVIICLEKELNEFILHEAFLLKIPSISILTNQNTGLNVTYPILGNNVSFESLYFYSNIILNSIKSGFVERRVKFLKFNSIFLIKNTNTKKSNITKKLNFFVKNIKKYDVFFIKKLIRRFLYYLKFNNLNEI